MTAVSLRERKRIDTRGRIMAAASRQFLKRGIEDVTVDEIAADADIGKGTGYNYFEGKEDIVVAMVVELDRSALAAVAEIPRQGMSVAEALDGAGGGRVDNK